MQSKDIHVGEVYMTTRLRPALVIDKGQFSMTHSSDHARVVTYKTLKLDVGRNWYFPNPKEKTKVVAVDLNSSQVIVATGAQFKTHMSLEQMRDLLLKNSIDHAIREKNRELAERKYAFEQTLIQLFTDLTNTSEVLNYQERDNPNMILIRDSKFVMQMLSLWLKFEQSQGRTVGRSNSEPMDVLVDVADALEGISRYQDQYTNLQASATGKAAAELEKQLYDPFSVAVVG